MQANRQTPIDFLCLKRYLRSSGGYLIDLVKRNSQRGVFNVIQTLFNQQNENYRHLLIIVYEIKTNPFFFFCSCCPSLCLWFRLLCIQGFFLFFFLNWKTPGLTTASLALLPHCFVRASPFSPMTRRSFTLSVKSSVQQRFNIWSELAIRLHYEVTTLPRCPIFFIALCLVFCWQAVAHMQGFNTVLSLNLPVNWRFLWFYQMNRNSRKRGRRRRRHSSFTSSMCTKLQNPLRLQK